MKKITKRSDSFTTSEIAKICRVSTRIVTKWHDTHQLNGHRLPGSKHRRFTYKDIESFMKTNEMPMEWLKAVNDTASIESEAAAIPENISEESCSI